MIFRQKKKTSNPEISTASLPDIVFMLLFFFMVTTVIQDDQSAIEIEKPKANLTEKVEVKDASALLTIGYKAESSIPVIYCDNVEVSQSKVGETIHEKMILLPESQQGQFFTMIKADKSLPMEVITDIKQQLREYQLLKIKYIVTRGV